MVDFIFIINSGNLPKSAFFEALSANFRWKRVSPTNHCWCQKTRLIAVSCGIIISPLHCLVMSESTCVTDRRTDRHKYDSVYCTSIAARAVKKVAEQQPFLIFLKTYIIVICHIFFPGHSADSVSVGRLGGGM